ncbi:uncharacterized protein LOC106462300 [Limulus polyphemus]|uniref:Uncharacterized protein LOC106462300 n=1 Tax=Limulus polyphemus TaxID=6850 RepID=A0ABM1SNL0_LIMPO|nr:uncharacterized protein LOC106462300 [Limulus polyphemus]XP_022245212.1 uncharacterized protein LOC106462300 [Limulus polyphemus]XP_022245213.1 uncharacterized protein LOC106462300 [Limulus polyphemus]XP_022245214.1 uncharacterized protein LOC106462300 [Limulus polyphemus]XP_022245215.1 uncharacterized protein LOC106462300 [Limulus polyphemus]XP_022245216.1 uncharacterized protein LOC106462300 [Limulus polyphemus]
MARHLYETAFDSKVRREVEDIDELAQSPVLSEFRRRRHSSGPRSGSAPSSTSGSSSNTPTHQPYVIARESPRRVLRQALPQFCPTEKRKVTLVRDSPRSSPIHSRNHNTGPPPVCGLTKGTEFELKKYGRDSPFLGKKNCEKESSFTESVPEYSKKAINPQCLVSTSNMIQKEKSFNKLVPGSDSRMSRKMQHYEIGKPKSFETLTGSLDRKNFKTDKNNFTSKLFVENGAFIDNAHANKPDVFTSINLENKRTDSGKKFLKRFEMWGSPKRSNTSDQEKSLSKSFISGFKKDSSMFDSKQSLNNPQLFIRCKHLVSRTDQNGLKDISKTNIPFSENSQLSKSEQNAPEKNQPLRSNSQNARSPQDNRLLWNVSELKLKSDDRDPLKENKTTDESNNLMQGKYCQQLEKGENTSQDDSFVGKEDHEHFKSDKDADINEKTVMRPKRPGSLPIPSLAGVFPPMNIRTHQTQSPTDSPKFPKTDNSGNKPSTSKDSGAPTRPTLNLSLNLNIANAPKRARQQLVFSFGCPILSAVGETIDPNIPLERQGWYHGSISRIDAEKLLRSLKEGSYLVRNSKSSKGKFSLSLKSAKGFMHMKIVHSDEKFILGQFGRSFDSVPEMVHHYSVNTLPIKGAEHMSLLHPVIDQLL